LSGWQRTGAPQAARGGIGPDDDRPCNLARCPKLSPHQGLSFCDDSRS
jgi:hypothetical protein